MATRPDYRQSPSATPEGSGRSKARRQKFLDSLPLDVVEDAYRIGKQVPMSEALHPDVVDEIAGSARIESELLGFWLAWQRAGGFAALEAAGWHRATIFRKVRSFRDYFSVHPDDYRPAWITLNLTKVWTEEVRRRIDARPDGSRDAAT